MSAFSRARSFLGNLEAFQVEQGVAVEQVALMRREQNLQEVHPALGVGREERGEQIVADVQRVPAFAPVLGGGVVGLQVRRDLAGGRQQAVFLLVKRLVPFGQQAIDLAGRDVHSQFQQLLVQQRLGDVVVKMLVERILPERRTEMRC